MLSNSLKIIFYCLALSFTFLSCKDSERKEVNSLLKVWIGKELIFPSNQYASIMGDSTVLFSDYISDNSRWKIVFYADSLGCVSCDLNLLEQKQEVTVFSGMRTMQNIQVYHRQFDLTLRYKFNATKSKYKGTGAGESQKSRM